MRSLALRMIVKSPLAIRADHAAGGAANVKSIPGTTLLGGLASLYRMFYHDKPEINAFAALFLSDEVFYPPLYPALFNDEGLQGQNRSPVYPLPITSSSCKRHQGFLFPDNAKNDGHGVRDMLIDWLLFKSVCSNEKLRRRISPLEILRASEKCATCGEAMDHFEGYYRRNEISPYQLIAADTITRLQTHTGIHRESGTVQDGILYNRQVFEEGMEFWGELLFPENELLLTRFTDFISLISREGLLHLGTGHTRGMGKVSLIIEESAELDRFNAFLERMAAFNQAVKARVNELEIGDFPESYFFALTLHSPLLLLDDLLRYQSYIDVKTLQKEIFPCELRRLKLLYYASSLKRITGWQELWGTPRAGEYAIDTGSVFLFTCSSPPDTECLRALFTLEERGMGKRQAEGFGRVRVCDQFHQLVRQEL